MAWNITSSLALLIVLALVLALSCKMVENWSLCPVATCLFAFFLVRFFVFVGARLSQSLARLSQAVVEALLFAAELAPDAGRWAQGVRFRAHAKETFER